MEGHAPDVPQFPERIRKQHEQWKTKDYPKYAPPGNAAESWSQCRKLAETYDKGLCEAYREQIDTLLVFAGLFSAVVTAFTIESYKWLDNSAEDAAVQLLSQIAGGLSVNGTASRPPSSALMGPVTMRINIYWFISLALGLSAALVGILVKQWVREYDRESGRTPQEALGVRQMRYQGLEAWGVASIVTAVPLLLQAALLLFFAGITELLWLLNRRVAIPLIVVVSLVVVFYVTTTVLPAAQLLLSSRYPRLGAYQCPYKSPQGWLILKAVISVMTYLFPRRKNSWDWLDEEIRVRSFHHAMSWREFDLTWTLSRETGDARKPRFAFRALAWLKDAVNHPDLRIWTWHCLWDTDPGVGVSAQTHGDIWCIIERLPLAPATTSGLDDNLSPIRMPEKDLTPCIGLLLSYAALYLPHRCALLAIDVLCEIYGKQRRIPPLLHSWAMDWFTFALFKCEEDGLLSNVVLERSLLFAFLVSNTGESLPSSALQSICRHMARTLNPEKVRRDVVAAVFWLAIQYVLAIRQGRGRGSEALKDLLTLFSTLISIYVLPETSADLAEMAGFAKACDKGWKRLPGAPPCSIVEFLHGERIVSASQEAYFRRLVALSGSASQGPPPGTEPAAPGGGPSAEPTCTHGAEMPSNQVIEETFVPAHADRYNAGDVISRGLAVSPDSEPRMPAAQSLSTSAAVSARSQPDCTRATSGRRPELSDLDEQDEIDTNRIPALDASSRTVEPQCHLLASSALFLAFCASQDASAVVSHTLPGAGRIQPESNPAQARDDDRETGMPPLPEQGVYRGLPHADVSPPLPEHHVLPDAPKPTASSELETSVEPSSSRDSVDAAEVGDNIV